MLIKPVETYYEDTYFCDQTADYTPSYWGIYLTDQDLANQWFAAFSNEKDAIEYVKMKEQNANQTSN